jgi:hypothetical protein
MYRRIFNVSRRVLTLSALVMVVGACSALRPAVPIRELVGQAAQNDGKAVKISGRVTGVLKLPFMEARFFTVRDATGEIPVMTYDEPPTVNTETTVSGVFSNVAIAGTDGIGAHIKVARAKP